MSNYIDEEESVDIRPSLGDILSGYSRESYKPETAIAEFVDNSTASFYINEKEYKKVEGDKPMTVAIRYDKTKKILTIYDTAWGMDKDTFRDAITIAKKPKIQGGRNEYGLGLKKAASWFGKEWTVETKGYGQKHKYTADIDIDELVSSKENEVKIVPDEADPKEHYTLITIYKLNRTITDNSIKKLKNDLSSIYRNDIRSGKIVIKVNGEPLEYKEPAILTEVIDDKEVVWKKEFSDTIWNNAQQFHFNGFVAIRDVGSTSEAGFTLMRRGRVIVGGLDKNYRPKEIFGNSNSFEYQRIFGEINLDDFPVTQAKDAFDWELDGLEDIFIDKLKGICSEYVRYARNYRKKKDDEGFDIVDAKDCNDELIDELKKGNAGVKFTNDKVNVIKTQGKSDIKTTSSVNILNNEYKFNVEFSKNVKDQLINYTIKDDVISIITNVNHPYFENVNDDPDFQKAITKFLCLFVLAEITSNKIHADNEGKIYSSTIRETLNSLLDDITNNKKYGVY